MFPLITIAIVAGGPLSPQDFGKDPVETFKLMRAASLAAREQHRGFSAKVTFAETANGVAEANPSFSGTVRWSGDRVWYALFEDRRPDLLWSGYVRDRERTVIASVFEDSSDMLDPSIPRKGRTQFEIHDRSLSRSAITKVEGGGQADPLLWFGGVSDHYAELLAEKKVAINSIRQEGSMTVVEFRGPATRVNTVWYDRDIDFLPVRQEVRFTPDASRVNVTVVFEWDRIGGLWILKRQVEDYLRRDQKGGTHSELVFSDIKVDHKFTDAELSAESLPIPFGARGIDRRSGSTKGLVKEATGFIPLGTESAAAKAAYQAMLPERDPAKPPQGAAKLAAAERANYYWWLAARICAGAAAAILVIAVGIWWWRRGS